jgi:hypothetical protein
MRNAGAHWFEISIAGGPIHNGMELSLKRDRMAAARYLKFRRIGTAINNDVVERSGVTPDGRKYSREAVYRAQVCIAK